MRRSPRRSSTIPRLAPSFAKEPPQPIQEMPPDQKPAGQNIQWIPGYWAGTSRATTSSGSAASGASRRPIVSGFPATGTKSTGATSGSREPGFRSVRETRAKPAVVLAPAPAEPRSRSQHAPALSQRELDSRLLVLASVGIRLAARILGGRPAQLDLDARALCLDPEWLSLRAGYWDLPVANRGLMFAPVYYPQPVYAQPNFVFTPSIGIVGSAVTANLFVQASTNQYMFGNFYAQNFVSVGITPWFSFSFATGPPLFYDPLFSYYAVINVRQNPGWVAAVREQYVLRRDRVELRPPNTYIEQTRIIERNVNITRNVTVVDHRELAMPLSRLAADPVAGRGMRMVKVEEAERQQFRQQVAQLHQFREQRVQQEREGARARAAGGAAAQRPRPMNLPHSPIASHPARATGSQAASLTAQRKAAPRLPAPRQPAIPT